MICRRARGGSGEGSGDIGDADSGDKWKGCRPFVGARALGSSSELSSDRLETFSKSELDSEMVNISFAIT